MLFFLSLTLGQEEDQMETSVPQECKEDDKDTLECTRFIVTEGNTFQMIYWVELEHGNVQTFKGQLEFFTIPGQVLDGQGNFQELRFCVEIAIPGQEDETREQLMFHGNVAEKQFNP